MDKSVSKYRYVNTAHELICRLYGIYRIFAIFRFHLCYESLKMKRLQIWLLAAMCFFGTALAAQSSNAPKREMRGVWVATVNNIDFPKTATINGVAQKEQWKKMVEKLKEIGINAVFVQVRPAADAFYNSELVPWSQYLTGKQGIAPEPFYDPLEYMIQVAHDAGMDFHAWINPYRASMNLDTLGLSNQHVFYRNRNWLVEYGGKLYLNPGMPEVRNHIIKVVEEIAEKYNIDGIHMDDYFYPYPVKDKAFPDSLQYQQYGAPYGSLQDWRRNNNDQLIEAMALAVKKKKPYLKFGISPFGVWRNKTTDPIGSDTQAGIQSYDDLYADILKWLEKGWIDYVVPQIYFNIGYPPADYEVLLNWWRKYRYNQKLIIGQAAYKVGDNPVPAWQDANEMLNQINMNRKFDDVEGSIFFSTKSLLNNPLGVMDSLSKDYFKYPALTTLTTQDALTPNVPKLKRVKGKADGVKIKWKPNKQVPTNGFGLLPPDYYVVYRWESPAPINPDDGQGILAITARQKKLKIYFDTTTQDSSTYVYGISAVNRFANESRLSNTITVKRVGDKAKKVK